MSEYLYEDIWEEIKDKVSLPEEMEKHGVTLIRANNRFKCLCPFHGEKDPSMIINVHDEVETYKCFGCQKSGSVIDYIMEVEGASLRGALNYFKENYDLQFSEDADIDDLISRKKRRRKRISLLSHMLSISRKVKPFLENSENPEKDLLQIKEYLRLADDAADLENIYYLKLARKKIKEIINILREKRSVSRESH